MGTSIAQAIDYIVAGIAAPLTAADPTAVVADGIAPSVSQSMVLIGKSAPDAVDSASGSQVAAVLGANRESEDYVIPCFAYAFRPGPTVKPARDAAVALFDVVAHFIASDRSLGGVLKQGRYCEISSIAINQDHDEAGSQVIVWIPFSIHCKNHYTP
jgi:hypothetical protein